MMTNMMTNEAAVSIATNWPTVTQAVSSVVAAIGTVAAVTISLYLAWHNRRQFQMTTRLNVLPTLIKEAESAATRLERNGIFFPRGGPGISWQPPTELRALKVALENLKKMEITEETKTFTYVVKQTAFEQVTEAETGHDRIRTYALLVPVIDNLIALREEFLSLAEKTKTKQ